MKRTNKILLIVTLMMPGFLMTSYAQKSIKLKYHLKKGRKYQSSLDMTQNMDMDIQGQSIVMNTEMIFEFDYTVTDVIADSFDLQTVITAVKMKNSVMGMDIVYDSKDTSTYNSPTVGTKISDKMNKMIGATINTTKSVYGDVGKVDMGTLDKDYNVVKNMKSSISQAIYPNYKIKVGDSWTRDITTPGLAKTIMHMKYTLIKFNRKQAFINVEATIDSPDVTAKLKGTMSGEMTVDRKTGWVVHSTFDQVYDMQMEKQGLSFPASISESYEINSKKVK